MSRVLLIGLDGATFDIIRPLIAQGRLPNLARMLEHGAAGKLQSSMPPITPTAWTSVITGKNPGKHGIYNFQDIDSATYATRPVRSDRHGEKSVWQLLGEASKTSVVIDVPYTFPPKPLNGVMITGYGTPRTEDTIFTYPPNLAETLPKALRPEIRVALPRHSFERSHEIMGSWSEIMAGRRKLLGHYMQQVKWDFFFVVFSITDYLAHAFWTYVEPTHPNYRKGEANEYRKAFYHAYEMCDSLVGDLMAQAGADTTTLIMSDHGFGSVYPRQYMFRKLAEGKYVKYKSPPFMSLFGDRLMKLAMRTYTGAPFLREWVKNMQPQRQKSMRLAFRRGGLVPHLQTIDYSQSRIIPSDFGVQLWINASSRFQQGIVPPQEKPALIEELSRYLLAQRDVATGAPIYAAVHRGQDIYSGPNAHEGPDLVVEYNNFFNLAGEGAADNARLEGGHASNGIFMAQGPAIHANQLSEATLEDLTPTLLHLLEQPVPPDMDGRVLVEIFDQNYMTEHPIQTGSVPARLIESPATEHAITSVEEEEIRTQLRQLGYID